MIKKKALACLLFLAASNLVYSSEKNHDQESFVMLVSDSFIRLMDAIADRNSFRVAIEIDNCMQVGDDLSYLYRVTAAELHEKQKSRSKKTVFEIEEIKALNEIVKAFETPSTT